MGLGGTKNLLTKGLLGYGASKLIGGGLIGAGIGYVVGGPIAGLAAFLSPTIDRTLGGIKTNGVSSGGLYMYG